MALDESNGSNNGMVMPVQPMGYGSGYGYPAMGYPMMMGGGMGGFGGYGGDWAWILLLLLIGGNGWGGIGGWGGMGGMMGLGIDFPWLLNGQNQINANTNAGFDHAATQAALGNLSTAVTSGFGDVQTALCGGFGGVNQNISSTGAAIQNALCQGFAGTTAAVNGAQNALAQQLYTNQIADLERSFAAQTANTAGLNAVQGQLAQCCYDNRLGTESLRATVLSENCADRYEAANNTRDIIQNATGNTTALLNTINGGIQSIKDQLCQDKIDAKNDEIAQLRQELLYSRGQASQDVQTARILAGQTNEVDALYNRLNSCPVPCTPVYGRTPIFTCNNGGCGNNVGFVA